MAKYQITNPAGEMFEIEAPDMATEQEVLQYAQEQFKQQGDPFANVEAMDRPIEPVEPFSEINRIAKAGYQGIAQGVQNLFPGQQGNPTASEVAGGEKDPSKIAGTIGAVVQPANILAAGVGGIGGPKTGVVQAAKNLLIPSKEDVHQAYKASGLGQTATPARQLAEGLGQKYATGEDIIQGAQRLIESGKPINPDLAAKISAYIKNNPTKFIKATPLGAQANAVMSHMESVAQKGSPLYAKAADLAAKRRGIMSVGKTLLGATGIAGAAGLGHLGWRTVRSALGGR